jgi:hypothetical protein
MMNWRRHEPDDFLGIDQLDLQILNLSVASPSRFPQLAMMLHLN